MLIDFTRMEYSWTRPRATLRDETAVSRVGGMALVEGRSKGGQFRGSFDVLSFDIRNRDIISISNFDRCFLEIE